VRAKNDAAAKNHRKVLELMGPGLAQASFFPLACWLWQSLNINKPLRHEIINLQSIV
jgi:hypothetical protein